MTTPWRPQRIRCKFGPRCKHLRFGTCFSYHPPEETRHMAQYAEQRRVTRLARAHERMTVITQDLGEPVLLAGPKGTSSADANSPVGSALADLRIGAERVLGSFNKVADDTIAVPGCPRQFTPPTAHVRVQKDKAEKSKVFPRYTFGLEPLVRTVQCMTPEVDVLGGACDVVANAGSLYRLFNFLVGTLILTIRVDLEWRSRPDGTGTLLMQIWKDDPDHYRSYGYGNSFETATCAFTPGLPDPLPASFTHHRVLYYELGGLRFAVHCEVDASYAPPAPPPRLAFPLSPPVSPKLSMAVPSPAGRRRASTASSAARGSRFSVLLDPSSCVSSDTLTVEYPCGPAVPVPPAHLVELKTFDNAARKYAACKYPTPDPASDSSDQYVYCEPDSQLYFSRTFQLYNAGHDRGVFSQGVPVVDVTARLQKWEAERQADLTRLVVFLQRLCALVAASAARGQPRMSLVLPGNQDAASAGHVRAALYARDDGVSFLPETL